MENEFVLSDWNLRYDPDSLKWLLCRNDEVYRIFDLKDELIVAFVLQMATLQPSEFELKVR